MMTISATYVVMVVMGHGVMRLVAGPARADRLRAQLWEPAEPNCDDRTSARESTEHCNE